MYRDAAGDTPVFRAVKTAEQRLVDTQASKSYLGSRGAADFCDAIQALSLGSDAASAERVMTLQTPGGSGALRVAAGIAKVCCADGDAWRPCQIFPGKLVNAKGWCSVWAPKP